MEEGTLEWAEQFAAIGKDIAEDMGHGNFIPTLFIVPEDGHPVVMGLIGVPPGHMYEAIQTVIGNYKPISLLALTADTYLERYGHQTPEEAAQRLTKDWEPLAPRFERGDPNVTEGLHTMVLSAAGAISIHQCYKWTPVDGWEWEEPETTESSSATNRKWERLINDLPLEDAGTIVGLSHDVVGVPDD